MISSLIPGTPIFFLGHAGQKDMKGFFPAQHSKKLHLIFQSACGRRRFFLSLSVAQVNSVLEWLMWLSAPVFVTVHPLYFTLRIPLDLKRSFGIGSFTSGIKTLQLFTTVNNMEASFTLCHVSMKNVSIESFHPKY